MGLAVAAKTPGEFFFSRICFIVAAILTPASFAWLTYESELNWQKLSIGALLGAISVAGLLAGLDWIKARQNDALPRSQSASSPIPESQKLTLASLFAADFPDTSRYEIGAQLALQGGRSIEIRAKRFINFASRAKFVGFYVPASPDTFAICEYLAEGYKESLQHMDDTFKVNGQVLGESGRTMSDDLIFSGRIFIYHEDYLSPEQIGALVGAYKAKNLDVKFRSQEYLINRKLAQDRNVSGVTGEAISQRSVEITNEINQVAPLIDVLKSKQVALAESDLTKTLLGRVIVQFDQLESGIAAQERMSGTTHTEERLAAAEHAIKELRALLGDVATQTTPQGQILMI
jgi:hypothetical protein